MKYFIFSTSSSFGDCIVFLKRGLLRDFVSFLSVVVKISMISCFQEEEVEHYTQQLEDLEQQVMI